MSQTRPEARQIVLDLDPDRLALAVGSMPYPAILESGPGFHDAGRWSVYAAEPRFGFLAWNSSWRITTPPISIHEEGTQPGSLRGSGDPLDALASWLDRLGIDPAGEPPGPDEPPFRGGVIGYFSYDLAPRIERLPRKAVADSLLPDIQFHLYDSAVSYDRRSGQAVLHAWDLLHEGAHHLDRRVQRWMKALQRPPDPPARTVLRSPLVSNFTQADYLQAVERAIEYIRAGDVFQVNLSQRFEGRRHGPGDQIVPLDLFLRTRKVSPAPFGAYLSGDDHAVISASPEWFFQTRGDRIVTRPIKGTRPRGATPDDDARLVAELCASAKDRAELTMIVDLERNDLGRVCEYGTVRVAGPFEVETYAQVHHLVATVEGRLRPHGGPMAVLRALFPGGSITGAPKIRAMEIIDELEPTRRSLYTGAIGYYSQGASGFNIPIRTLLVERDRVSYQVGGGIVVDSVPELEFEETLHKGRGLRAVLEGAVS